MSERITEAEIAELKRLDKVVTPEPWEWHHPRQRVEHDGLRVLGNNSSDESYIRNFDLNLLLAARNALPRLLVEREEMVGKIERLQELVDILGKPFDLNVLTAELRKAGEAEGGEDDGR